MLTILYIYVNTNLFLKFIYRGYSEVIMAVEINGNDDFKEMMKIYISTGLPFSSSTKIDILKKLILLANNNNEIYYLHDKVVALKGVYSQMNSSKTKQQISEVISLFRERKSFFDENPVQTEEKIEKYINNYLIERRNRLIGVGQEKAERVGLKTKENKERKNVKRRIATKHRKPRFSGDGLSDPKEIIQTFFSLSVREKRPCLDYLETMNISFEETLSLYEEYVFSREGKGNSARGQLILREYLLRMLIFKVSSFDECLIFCNLINPLSKERETIISKMINCLSVPRGWEKLNKDYQGKDFKTLLYLYLKHYNEKELRSIIFERMNKSAFTLNQLIIVYTLMITASYVYKVAVARKISLSIKTPADLERVQKIIPKWDILWGNTTESAKEMARS